MAIEPAAFTELSEIFYRDVQSLGMSPLWRTSQPGPRDGVPAAPYQPCHWSWSDIQQTLNRAAEIVKPGPEAERRALQLCNPGVAPSPSPTHTLTAAVQMVMPGEIAPSHRHTMAAIRFIIQGEGAITMVNGEPLFMSPGDLILTPGWCWHGHINRTEAPMIWMDGLDVPLVRSLKAGLYEGYPDELHPATKPIDHSVSRYGSGHLRPVWEQTPTKISPMLKFPWPQTEQSLKDLAKVDSSPFDEVAMQYTNPSTGGNVLPTMGCWAQMLRPDAHTRAHRHSTCHVYHVFRGSGSTIVDGVQIDWKQGDFFALPPDCWHEHLNGSSSEPAFLFSTNDMPVFESLGLYREDAYPERDGHQDVVASYAARFGDGRN